MDFFVAADSYDRFMGRYSVPLAPQLASLAGVTAGQRVLDVGCGPGALTTELVRRLGPGCGGGGRSVGAVRRGRPRAAPRRPRRARIGRAPALSGSFVRRRPGPARRALHDRPGGRTDRDGAGDAIGRRRRRVCLGPWRRAGAARSRTGKRRAGPRSGRRRRVRHGRRPSRAARRAVRERRPARDRGDEPRRQRGASDASTTGGSRSRSAWDRPAPMLPASIRFARRSFGSAVGIAIRRRRSS